MPQYPITSAPITNFTALNVTAAKVIKTGNGRLGKVIVIAPGSTSGAFTLNDSATVAGASAANTLFTVAYNATNNVAGSVFTFDAAFVNGLVVSAVPGAGTPQLVITYS